MNTDSWDAQQARALRVSVANVLDVPYANVSVVLVEDLPLDSNAAGRRLLQDNGTQVKTILVTMHQACIIPVHSSPHHSRPKFPGTAWAQCMRIRMAQDIGAHVIDDPGLGFALMCPATVERLLM